MFANLCESYQRDLIPLGVTMLSGHLETLLTHFKNSKLFFESKVNGNKSLEDPEGEGEGEIGGEGREEGEGEVIDEIGIVELPPVGDYSEGVSQVIGNLSEVVSGDMGDNDPSCEYQETLEENIEKIHSLPPSR
jgi:hypothetical protein